MLVDTAEVNNPKNQEMHKSDMELWRLLMYNFDLASTFQCDKHPREYPQRAGKEERTRIDVETQRPQVATTRKLHTQRLYQRIQSP